MPNGIDDSRSIHVEVRYTFRPADFESASIALAASEPIGLVTRLKAADTPGATEGSVRYAAINELYADLEAQLFEKCIEFAGKIKEMKERGEL
jgi:hypothetical protein